MEHCPANKTGKELNPKEIVLGLRGYLNEFGPQSEEPLLGKYNTQEAAFECTTCGACEFQCPVGIEHVPIIVGLRRGAVNTGAWENDYGAKLFLALERGSNALGMSPAERDKFVEKHALPIFDGTQEYCLWLGCMGGVRSAGTRDCAGAGAGDAAPRRELRRAAQGKMHRRPGAAAGQRSALPATGGGEPRGVGAESSVKKIISICPHCVRTIQEDWKEFGTPPEVEHHSEFLARLRRPAAVKSKTKRKIVFHDPCYLGRYRNVYDEPRQVAALAGELVEAPRSHERSFCCGAGGGLAFLGEEKGERVSHVRAEELVATGARLLQRPAPSAIRCSGMRSRRAAKARRSCWTLRRWRRGDCRRTDRARADAV